MSQNFRKEKRKNGQAQILKTKDHHVHNNSRSFRKN